MNTSKNFNALQTNHIVHLIKLLYNGPFLFLFQPIIDQIASCRAIVCLNRLSFLLPLMMASITEELSPSVWIICLFVSLMFKPNALIICFESRTDSPSIRRGMSAYRRSRTSVDPGIGIQTCRDSDELRKVIGCRPFSLEKCFAPEFRWD